MKQNPAARAIAMLCLLLMPFLLIAQDTSFNLNRLSQVYRLRETQASPLLRQTLAQQRKLIAEKKLGFEVGNTAVSELQLSSITGAMTVNMEEAARVTGLLQTRKLSPETLEIIRQFKLLPCAAGYKTYDARNQHLVPAIRFQHCGNCWSYSAVGALESSNIKVNSISNPLTVDLSEKQMVACSGAGSCSGGWPYKVFEYLKTSNARVMADSYAPDNGTDQPCPVTPASANVQVLDWGLADASAGLHKIASVNEIKQAICTYGAVSVCLMATPLFQNFAGNGVFYEQPSNYSNPSINHAVVLIGWDDNKQAWLLRNSWGTNWGDQGYCWIKYNSNNIGYGAIWVVAKKRLRIIKEFNQKDLSKKVVLTTQTR